MFRGVIVCGEEGFDCITYTSNSILILIVLGVAPRGRLVSMEACNDAQIDGDRMSKCV